MKRALIFNWVITGGGLALILYALFLLRRILHIRTWPFVPAQIKGGDLAWDFSSGHGMRKLKLTYSYAVDGRTFENQRITVSDYNLAAGELLVRSIVKNHILPGPKAYYCPTDPSQALLVRPGFGLPLTLAAIGIGIVLLSYFVRQSL